MRHSEQREAVYRQLKNSKDHPTADMLFLRVREINPKIGLGTVYRNLRQLSEEGQILTLETTDKKIHYDGDTSEHSHFICEKCGKIMDIYESLPLPQSIADCGITVTSKKTVFYGLCRDCAKLQNK